MEIMTKYNAVLVSKSHPEPVAKGFTKYAGKFLIATEDHTKILTLEASQLKPIKAEYGDEIIIDVTTKSVNGNTYYNINPFTSYEKSPFPLIKQTYTTILDEDGRDEILGLTFEEYPFREVKICKTRAYNNYQYDFDVTYEIVEAGEEIDFTQIRNIDLREEPLWPIKTESDPEHLLEALRDYLPAEEHPHKESYSATKIFQCYLPAGRGKARDFDPPRRYQYGSHDNRCICGHYIEDVRWVEYQSLNGIALPLLGAIGNCCIKHFAVSTGLYTRLLADIVENYKSGNIAIMRDISKKNGFGDLQMRLLERHVLTPDELKTLESALRDRSKMSLNNSLKRILYHISEFYSRNYNYEFKSSD